jgi:hypothetical protein
VEIFMSESAHLPSASDATAPFASIATPPGDTTTHTATSAPVAAETRSLLEAIDRGLAPDADDAMRAAARELWAQLAQSLMAAAAAPSTASVPTMPAAPAAFGLPNMPGLSSPASLVMAARALKQLPPDQLLDMVLGRLRAALPAGAAVPTPRGIQFQLVPVPPSGDGR